MSPAEGRIRKKDGVRGVWIIPSNDERKVADLGDSFGKSRLDVSADFRG